MVTDSRTAFALQLIGMIMVMVIVMVVIVVVGSSRIAVTDRSVALGAMLTPNCKGVGLGVVVRRRQDRSRGVDDAM
ncbi:MAG: hypothetical protein ABIO75_06970 [Thermomonas sp.]